MLFDKKSWKDICQGFMVRDCTIGFADGRIGLMLVEMSDERDAGWRTRFVSVRMDAPMSERFFVLEASDLSFASLASAWAPSQEEFLVVDLARQVWAYKPKTYRDFEEAIAFDGRGYGYAAAGEVGSAINKLVRVCSKLYALGSPLRIFERLPRQTWKEHTGIPIPSELKSRSDKLITKAIGNSGFNDLSGFSGNDLYAVGDAGAVWHFNGTAWEKLPFPSDRKLYTVTCGGDCVYITDITGTVWKGRHGAWELIEQGHQTLPFADAAWFQDTLWCANDDGMRVLENNRMVAAHLLEKHAVPDAVARISHCIDVSPDGRKMLVCGGQGAALHDGVAWQLLFSGAQ